MSGRRFFQADDGALYYVVAVDLEHAKRVLADAHVELDAGGVGVTWSEMEPARVRRIKCDRDDGNPKVALGECSLGEWLCTEW